MKSVMKAVLAAGVIAPCLFSATAVAGAGDIPEYQLAHIGPFASAQQCVAAARNDVRFYQGCYYSQGNTNHEQRAGYYYSSARN